jgi:hypothetical protein
MERTDLPMTFEECITQSAALASKGKGVERLVYARYVVVTQFFTPSQFVSIGCGVGGMIVNKETISEHIARGNTIIANEKAKTASLSKQLGL